MDTKCLARNYSLFNKAFGRNTSLGHLYELVGGWVADEKETGVTINTVPLPPLEGLGPHSASYDAFMTGAVYLSMYQKMAGVLDIEVRDFYSSTLEVFGEHANSINLIRHFQAFFLKKPQRQHSDSHKNTFFVSGIAEVTYTALTSFFAEFGQPRVFAINRDCAYVRLRRNDKQRGIDIEGCVRKLNMSSWKVGFTGMRFEDAKRQGILKSILYARLSSEPDNILKRKLQDASQPSGKRRKLCTIL